MLLSPHSSIYLSILALALFIPQPWLQNYSASLCSNVQKHGSQSSVCRVHLDIVQSGLWLQGIELASKVGFGTDK